MSSLPDSQIYLKEILSISLQVPNLRKGPSLRSNPLLDHDGGGECANGEKHAQTRRKISPFSVSIHPEFFDSPEIRRLTPENPSGVYRQQSSDTTTATTATTPFPFPNTKPPPREGSSFTRILASPVSSIFRSSLDSPLLAVKDVGSDLFVTSHYLSYPISHSSSHSSSSSSDNGGVRMLGEAFCEVHLSPEEVVCEVFDFEGSELYHPAVSSSSSSPSPSSNNPNNATATTTTTTTTKVAPLTPLSSNSITPFSSLPPSLSPRTRRTTAATTSTTNANKATLPPPTLPPPTVLRVISPTHKIVMTYKFIDGRRVVRFIQHFMVVDDVASYSSLFNSNKSNASTANSNTSSFNSRNNKNNNDNDPTNTKLIVFYDATLRSQLTLDYTSLNTCLEFTYNVKCVTTASSSGYILLTPFPYRQSKVMLMLDVEVKSHLNTMGRALNLNAGMCKCLMRETLNTARNARDVFYRGNEVDACARKHFTEFVVPNTPPLNLKESTFLNTCLSVGGDPSLTWRRHQDSKSQFPLERYTTRTKTGRDLFHASEIVHANVTEVAAYVLYACSNERMKSHHAFSGNLPRTSTPSKGSPHGLDTHVEFKIPGGIIANRVFNTYTCWGWVMHEGSNVFVIGFGPLEYWKNWELAPISIRNEIPEVVEEVGHSGVGGEDCEDCEEGEGSGVGQMIARALCFGSYGNGNRNGKGKGKIYPTESETEREIKTKINDTNYPSTSTSASTSPASTPSTTSTVEGTNEGFYMFIPISPNVTKMQITQNVVFGGRVPKTLFSYVTKYLIEHFESFAVKFRRQGRVVDGEIQEALCGLFEASTKVREGANAVAEKTETTSAMSNSTSTSDSNSTPTSTSNSTNLTPEQLTFIQPCLAIAREFDTPDTDSELFPIECSNFYNLSMWLRLKSANTSTSRYFFSKKKGTGRSEGVADCSAARGAAFVFDFRSICSETSQEGEGGLSRAAMVIHRTNGFNDHVSALVLKLPFPLAKFEVVFRQIIWKDEKTGDFYVAGMFIDNEVVDYGRNFGKLERGRPVSLYRFIPVGVGEEGGGQQCRIQLTQLIEVGGRTFPLYLLKMFTRFVLVETGNIMKRFSRDLEIDSTNLTTVAQTMVLPPPLLHQSSPPLSSPTTAEENAIVARVTSRFTKASSEGRYTRFKYTPDDPFVTTEYLSKGGSTTTTATNASFGRASVTVDASMSSTAAYHFNIDSRARYTHFIDANSGKLRVVTDLTTHSKLVYAIVDIMKLKSQGVNGVFTQLREFTNHLVWKHVLDEDSGSGNVKIKIVVCSEPAVIPPGSDMDVKNRNHAFHQGTSVIAKGEKYVYATFESLPDLHGVEQTRVVYCSNVIVGAGGYYGTQKAMVVGRMMQGLGYLGMVRQRFQKDGVVDGIERGGFVRLVGGGGKCESGSGSEKKNNGEAEAEAEGGGEVYSVDENHECERAVKKLDSFESHDRKKRLKSNTPLIHIETAVHTKTNTSSNSCDSDSESESENVPGRLKMIVRSPILQVLAFFWCTNSRERKYPTSLQFSHVNEVNRHNKVETYTLRFPSSSSSSSSSLDQHREFAARCMWKQLSAKQYLYISTPSSTRSSSSLDKHKQMTSDQHRSAFRFRYKTVRLTVRKATQTNVEVMMSVDHTSTSTNTSIKSSSSSSSSSSPLPSYVIRQVLGTMAKSGLKLQEYFQQLRTLEQFDTRDGKNVAESFLIKRSGKDAMSTSSSSVASRVKQVIRRHEALNVFSEMHPAFVDIMVGVVQNKLRPPSAVRSRFGDLSGKDGAAVGGGLALALLASLTPNNAVEEWILRYPALVELDRDQPWFRPMCIVLGQRLFGSARWGVIVRVYFGAFISILDTVTDVLVIAQFLSEGQSTSAFAIGITAIANVVAQLVIIYFQHNKRITVMLREMIIAAVGLKPAVDAYRIASAKSKQTWENMDCITETTYSKGINIVFEALPAGCLQTYILINSTNDSANTTTVTSVVLSALSVAYTSASISYDWDINPDRRSQRPEFYGYIKNDGTSRVITFLSMFFLTCAHVMMRTLAMALLASVTGLYVLAFFVVDTACFFLFRYCWNDLRYFVVRADGMSSWVLTFLARIGSKILVDFSLCMQLRHSYEVGGFYFMYTVIFTPILACISANLYVGFVFIELNDNKKLEADTLWTILGTIFIIWVVSLGCFWSVIDEKYYKTFYSLQTGKEFSKESYYCAETDAQRATIFNQHPSFYSGIETELRQWLEDRWKEGEKPDFITPDIMADIPKRLLPVAVAVEVEEGEEESDNVKATSQVSM